MLSKIGDEMFVQPQEGCLSLRTVNGSNSAFVDITFHDNYFSYYAYEDLDESEALKCKILIRVSLYTYLLTFHYFSLSIYQNSSVIYLFSYRVH